jgi:hypothetical protein
MVLEQLVPLLLRELTVTLTDERERKKQKKTKIDLHGIQPANRVDGGGTDHQTGIRSDLLFCSFLVPSSPSLGTRRVVKHIHKYRLCLDALKNALCKKNSPSHQTCDTCMEY